MGKAFEQGFGAERDTGYHPKLHIRPQEGMEHDPGATTVSSTWGVSDQDPPFTEWGAFPRRPFEHHPSAVAVEFAGLIDKARQAGAAAFRSTLTAEEARERVPPGAKPFLLGEGMRLRVVDRNGTPVAFLGSLAKDRKHAWAVVADMNRAYELGASAGRDGEALGDFTLASERGSDEWQVGNPSRPGVVFGTMDRNPLAALLGIPASAEVTSYAGLIGLAATAGHASQTPSHTVEETFAPGP